MTDLSAKIDKLTLLGQSGVEAISFALAISEEYDAIYAMDFLQLWHEGCWPEIAELYPEFDLNSDAHKVLIADSGGMPEI